MLILLIWLLSVPNHTADNEAESGGNGKNEESPSARKPRLITIGCT